MITLSIILISALCTCTVFEIIAIKQNKWYKVISIFTASLAVANLLDLYMEAAA